MVYQVFSCAEPTFQHQCSLGSFTRSCENAPCACQVVGFGSGVRGVVGGHVQIESPQVPMVRFVATFSLFRAKKLAPIRCSVRGFFCFVLNVVANRHVQCHQLETSSTALLRAGAWLVCGARSDVPGLPWLYLQRQHCKHRLHKWCMVYWSSKGIGSFSSQLIFIVVHH